jgi:hypothetical protein
MDKTKAIDIMKRSGIVLRRKKIKNPDTAKPSKIEDPIVLIKIVFIGT